MPLGPRDRGSMLLQIKCFMSTLIQRLYRQRKNTGCRGITFQGAIRKKPNAFVIVYHMKLVHKMGRDAAQEVGFEWLPFKLDTVFNYMTLFPRLEFEVNEWESVGQFVSAYKMGRAEGAAALALLQDVDAEIYEELTRLVK